MAKYRAERRKARELKRLAAREAIMARRDRSSGGTNPSGDPEQSPRTTIPWARMAIEFALLGSVAYAFHIILK